VLAETLVTDIVARLDRLEALVLCSCVLFNLELVIGFGLVAWLRSGGNAP
jgi:hypothetical protein